MSFMFGGGFEIMFTLVFLLIFGMVIVIFVKGIAQWKRNNDSPRLTVDAIVVAKRTQVGSHHHSNGSGVHHTTHSTSYYVTFQVDSGDRMELPVASYDFGMLVEGDRGRLSFQGTRFLGFERE